MKKFKKRKVTKIKKRMTKNNKGDKKRVKSNDERDDPTMRETIQR